MFRIKKCRKKPVVIEALQWDGQNQWEIEKDARHSGIDITWTPSAGRLDIGGWYDTMVGIQSGSMTLAEFFAKLGITEKDVLKALSANTGDKAR